MIPATRRILRQLDAKILEMELDKLTGPRYNPKVVRGSLVPHIDKEKRP